MNSLNIPKDTFTAKNSGPKEKTGVLLVQTGSPDDASPKAVRRFLKEFLSDPHIIHKNPLIWSFLLNFFILPSHTKKSAQLYKDFFEKHGRMLINVTESLRTKLYENLSGSHPFLIIKLGMRYGNPSLVSVLKEMINKDQCSKILILPLFPQYSHTTTGSIQDNIRSHLRSLPQKPKVKFISSFYKFDSYINSLTEIIQNSLQQCETPPERLLLSYHGIPQDYADKGDPYPQHCEETTAFIKEELGYSSGKILTTFQSRFGRGEWLKPYTDQTLISLAQNKVKHVAVVCPSFTIDCLETLDEVGEKLKKLFIQHGGEKLTLIPSLNDHPKWINALASLLKDNLSDW